MSECSEKGGEAASELADLNRLQAQAEVIQYAHWQA